MQLWKKLSMFLESNISKDLRNLPFKTKTCLLHKLYLKCLDLVTIGFVVLHQYVMFDAKLILLTYLLKNSKEFIFLTFGILFHSSSELV